MIVITIAIIICFFLPDPNKAPMIPQTIAYTSPAIRKCDPLDRTLLYKDEKIKVRNCKNIKY
jgi:hypothetical protein